MPSIIDVISPFLGADKLNEMRVDGVLCRVKARFWNESVWTIMFFFVYLLFKYLN